MIDGEFFREKARLAKVSSEDLGAAIGRDRSVISRILSGQRPLKPEEIEPFARVLRIPIRDVVEHSGLELLMITPEGHKELRGQQSLSVAGFGEGDAAEWTPPPKDTARPSRVRDMAELLGGGKAGVDIWVVRGRAMSLQGYMEGDFLLVDAREPSRAKSGDVVIAQAYDWQQGSATTLLRRFEPPVLVSASPDAADQRAYVVDGNNVVIRGIVVASWRGGVKH